MSWIFLHLLSGLISFCAKIQNLKKNSLKPKRTYTTSTVYPNLWGMPRPSQEVQGCSGTHVFQFPLLSIHSGLHASVSVCGGWRGTHVRFGPTVLVISVRGLEIRIFVSSFSSSLHASGGHVLSMFSPFNFLLF